MKRNFLMMSVTWLVLVVASIFMAPACTFAKNYSRRSDSELTAWVNKWDGGTKCINVEYSHRKERISSLEFFDYDGDNVPDWIRYTEYNSAFRWGAHDIGVYRGPGELKHMMKEYGDHVPSLKGKNIPSGETGVSFYNGSYDGALFHPVSDERITMLFSLGDKLMAANKDEQDFSYLSFQQELKKILVAGVKQYPEEWRDRERFETQK